MATEKLYIAKLESGKELGPMDQDALVKLAENGTVTPSTLIRSKLIPEWNKSGSVDFLKDIIFQQQQVEMAQQAKNRPLYQKIYERITLVAPEDEQRGKIVKTKLETLPIPSPMLRFLAGIIDLVIILLGEAGIFALGKYCLDNEQFLTDDNAVYITVSAMLVFYLMYFTLFMGALTQTIGQRFWGIFLIRLNGKSFWLGRAFIYSLLLLPFGIFAPIFFILNVKTYPEMLTRTRFAKVLSSKKH